MIDDTQLRRLENLITNATATGHTDLAIEAADLLDRALAANAAETTTSTVQPALYAGACARHGVDASGPRKLRKGRTRCSATRRDGEPCQAPAIKGGSVCRVHGGSTRLAQIAAGLQVRQLAYVDAIEAWKEVSDFDSLCRMAAAERELDEYEAKLVWLRVLRRAARANDAAEMPTRAGG